MSGKNEALSAVLAVAGDAHRRSGTVASVESGHRLVLTDGQVVRLKAVEAPSDRTIAPALAETSRRALTQLVLGQDVSFDERTPQTDRYGRVIAFLTRSDGLDIQAELVSAGHVWVRSYHGDRARVAGLLAIEDEARAAKRGVWADEHQLIVSPNGAWQALDGFRIQGPEPD
jgi:endonuclease YncB( thermonuclease family)